MNVGRLWVWRRFPTWYPTALLDPLSLSCLSKRGRRGVPPIGGGYLGHFGGGGVGGVRCRGGSYPPHDLLRSLAKLGDQMACLGQLQRWNDEHVTAETAVFFRTNAFRM